MKKSILLSLTVFSIQIEKLKATNLKLRNRIKELNVVVEKAIEKANAKRVIMQKHKYENQDVSHLLQSKYFLISTFL